MSNHAIKSWLMSKFTQLLKPIVLRAITETLASDEFNRNLKQARDATIEDGLRKFREEQQKALT